MAGCNNRGWAEERTGLPALKFGYKLVYDDAVAQPIRDGGAGHPLQNRE